jgi:ATP-binding cassette subfamily B protein
VEVGVELFAPYRNRLLATVVLGLFGSAVALVVPWVAGRFAADLLTLAVPALLASALTLFGLLAVEAVIDYATGWLLGTTSQRLLLDARELLFDRIQRAPLLRVMAGRRGEVVNLSENDVNGLVGFSIGTLLELPPYLVTFLGALWLTAAIDPVVALLALLAMPLFFLLTRRIGRQLGPVTERLYGRHGEALSQLEENLGVLQVVKARGQEPAELARYRATSAEIQAENAARLRLQLLLTPLTRFAGSLAVVGALLVSAAVGRTHEVAELVALLLYGAVLYGPVTGLAAIYGAMQSARASVERLDPFLGGAGEVTHRGEPLVLAGPPAISAEKLSFSYAPGRPVLEDLDLSIDAGEFVVITGPNGVGKSTLALLLCGFVRPDGGRILVADQDVAACRLADLRAAIGLVHQGMVLFDRSIAENLGYGSPRPLDPASIRATGLLDFVEGLDGGFSFRVGAGGHRLSGGQRQRVALAAALLQAPPVLLLDEAASMLDEPTLHRVREYLGSLSGVTRIVIDHDAAAWPGARAIEL